MGLRGEAASVGYTELPATKRPTGPLEFNLEKWARLAAATLADAGLNAADVDGICTGHLQESQIFVSSTIIEYLGIRANFAELVDLGGASSAAMVWRPQPRVRLRQRRILSEQTTLVLEGDSTMGPLAKPRPVAPPTSQPFWDALRNIGSAFNTRRRRAATSSIRGCSPLEPSPTTWSCIPATAATCGHVRPSQDGHQLAQTVASTASFDG